MDRRVVALGVVVVLAATAGCLGLGSTDGTTTDDVTNESSTDDITQTTDNVTQTQDSESTEGSGDGGQSNGTDGGPETSGNDTAQEKEEDRYAYGDPVEESEAFDTQLPVDPPELEGLEVDMFDVGTAQADRSDEGCARNLVQMTVNNTFEEPTIVTFNFTIERAGGPDVHATGERHFRPNRQFNLVRLFRPYTLLGPNWCTSYEEDGPTLEALYVSVEKTEGPSEHGYATYGSWATDAFDLKIYDEVFYQGLESRENLALSSLTIGNETILPETDMPRDPLVD
ncbi:MAG: hypothetical protein V5A55_08070 [Halovenus sp.]